MRWAPIFGTAVVFFCASLVVYYADTRSAPVAYSALTVPGDFQDFLSDRCMKAGKIKISPNDYMVIEPNVPVAVLSPPDEYAISKQTIYLTP